jgi:hypothetical protein
MNKHQQQAIMARDMIDMIRDNSENADILEYLNSFAFSLARIFENDSPINWDELASICDQRYYSLKSGEPLPLDVSALNTLYEHILSYIEKHQQVLPTQEATDK